jgi:hypothetical protein
MLRHGGLSYRLRVGWDMIHIDRVEPRENHWLRLWFSDGAIKDVDMSDVIATGEVFEPIRESDEVFAQVRVNPETGTIEWPGEVDLDPLVLYGTFEAEGAKPMRRRVIREPDPATA